MDIYLVGGAVRDQLLHLPVNERDWVVVGATAEIMLKQGYRAVGKDFPVFLHPETQEEYALARTERKSGKGYTGFECDATANVTLEEDLKRRDLTINAMAMDDSGHIIDPYGGQSDMAHRLLRHVSPAFIEDPLRVLRVARFAARLAPLGFKVADTTMHFMQQMVASGELSDLTPERVWKEWQRALTEAAPEQFFLVLRECGALKVILPELDTLWGVPNPVKYHPEVDSGIHTMMVLRAASDVTHDPQIRFAALCHDLGKGITDPALWPSHQGHEEAGVRLIEKMAAHYRLPKAYRELAILVARYHGLCHRVYELTPKTLLNLVLNLDVIRRKERFEQFLLACTADYRGRTGFETKHYPQADYLSAVADIIAQVDIKPLVEQGLTGEALAKAIYEARLKALKQWKSNDE